MNVFNFLKCPVKRSMYDDIDNFSYVRQTHVIQKYVNISRPLTFLRKLQQKKNIKQTDKFTTFVLRKFLERDHHKAEIFLNNNYNKK